MAQPTFGYLYPNSCLSVPPPPPLPPPSQLHSLVSDPSYRFAPMQTRSGFCYPKPEMDAPSPLKRKREGALGDSSSSSRSSRRKRPRAAADFFDGLPDDLVLSILSKLSSSAACPSDLINALMTCKRFNGLGLNPLVLSRASAKSLAVRAEKWSEQAEHYLKRCADSGNLEACYILGMIKFYCEKNRGSGASLMAKAAIGSHSAALYALAVIQFNGSGGCKNDKDLRAGVALCARSAFLGHVDALRELGHCLQDGYGVRRNVAEGRRFLLQANARELAAVLPSMAWRIKQQPPHRHVLGGPPVACPLLSDFGCNVPAPEVHPANQFLVDWFGMKGFEREAEGEGLRLCSNTGCGRPETRRHEFRRCSVCGRVNYCSRACQALHWKYAHKSECRPMDRWLNDGANDNAEPAAGNGGVGVN